MARPKSCSDDQEEHSGTSSAAIQATSSFYTPAAFAINDLSPEYSEFQPTVWQHHFNNETDLEMTAQTWGTSRNINNHGPVMFDWCSSPIEAWALQRQNLEATSQDVPIMAFQSPRFNSEFQQEPPPKLEKLFEQDQSWQTGYRTQESCPVVEVAPPLWNGPGILASKSTLSPEVESAGRASKRRRRSSTPTMEIQFVPQMFSSMHPSLVGCSGQDQAMEQHRHVPTSITHVHSLAPPAIEGSPQITSAHSENLGEGLSPMTESPEPIIPNMGATPVPSTPILQESQLLTPSVRVISDRRESVCRLRRGSATVFKTQSANTKRGHYASEIWESHKPAIRRMYIDEGKPLREVIKAMEEDHNFPATQRMYKARFKQWGFVKNNTEKVISQILRTKFERDAAGKLSQFTRNGKDVNLQNYLQRKGLTEYDLVDFHPAAVALSHVRCRTPPSDIPEDLRLPDRLRFQDTLVMSFKRAFLLWRQEDQDNAFGFQPSVFTWRVTDFPHLSNLIESARLIRKGEGARGVAALNQAFWSMETYLASMDATASFYFFFHRQSRPWQEDARIALAVWKFLAAYASARNHSNHPLFHTFKLMYEVIQKEGVTGLRALLTECSNPVADELEGAFGKEHWLKDLIWHRCFPEKSKLRQMQLIRDLRDHLPTKKLVKRLY